MSRLNDREVLALGVEGGRLEIRASAKDMMWLRPLFTRCANQFLVLRDMGYEASTCEPRLLPCKTDRQAKPC
jgi:hypothetical protein